MPTYTDAIASKILIKLAKKIVTVRLSNLKTFTMMSLFWKLLKARL